MAPTHPFTSPNSTKFDSLFDEQGLVGASVGSLREGGGVPDFRDRASEVSEDLVFENLFEQAGGNLTGSLSGDRAVPFFQRSGLDSNTLYKIWQLADSSGEGVLRLPGFKVAMKLIGLAQSQLPVSLAYLREACPLPIFEGIRVSLPRSKVGPEGSRLGGRASSLSRSTPFASTSPFDRLAPTSWNQSSQGQSISLADSQKYYRIFRKASFNQDFLDGNAVRDIMMKSGLPVDILRDIWNLADTQDRGFLEAFEFIIAMHYVENFMNETLSDVPILLPLKIKESALLAAESFSKPYPSTSRQPNFATIMYPGPSSERTVLSYSPGLNTNRATLPIATTSGSDWAIPQAERDKYYGFFDSIVPVPTAIMPSNKAYDFFIKSQLPSSVLSQIWELATIENQNGLSRDEFAVAMHLIYSQLAGQVLPSQLPLNLIPPRFREHDPYSHETPGNTVPFDPFIDNVTNRSNQTGAVNSFKPSSVEPTVPHKLDSKSEDLLSFDDPSDTITQTNVHFKVGSQSTSTYKPASFNQITQVNTFSGNLPSQHIPLDHGLDPELRKPTEILRDSPSIPNSFQNIRSASNEPFYFQQQLQSVVQEPPHPEHQECLSPNIPYQKVEELNQANSQTIPQFNDPIPALSMVSETSLNQASVESAPAPEPEPAPSSPPVEENQIPDSNQDVDPFAALIETRIHSTATISHSNRKVTSTPTEADPFSDPSMGLETKQQLANSTGLKEEQPSLFDTKLSFDDLVAHRSGESLDTKPRFASFDDIASRDTGTPLAMVSDGNFTDQLVSSPPTFNNLPPPSTPSPTVEAKSAKETNELQSSNEAEPSSIKPRASPITSIEIDPFLALVQPLDHQPTDLKHITNIPIESPLASSGSLIGSLNFPAFGDTTKLTPTLPSINININTSEKLAAYLAQADLLSWSKTDLTSSEADLKLPELTYTRSDSLFDDDSLEFPPPKPMFGKEASSTSSFQKEAPSDKTSNPVSNDPFAIIANRTDPFDLPESTLDKFAKRSSAAASLRFEDAFGDDFPPPSNDVPEQANEPVSDSKDHNPAVDLSQIALPVSSNSLSLSAFKDPSSPEACRSASLYFDADDVNSSQLSASTDFPDSSPQASDAISILIAMGFAPNAAADALARFDNDTDKATHYLLDNQISSPSQDTLPQPN